MGKTHLLGKPMVGWHSLRLVVILEKPILLLGKPSGKTHSIFGKTCSLYLAALAPSVSRSFLVRGVGGHFRVAFWEKPISGKPFAFSPVLDGVGVPFLDFSQPVL